MNLIKKWFFRVDLTRDVKVPFMQLIKGDHNTQSFVVTLLNNGDIVEVKDTDIITLNIDKSDGTKSVIAGEIDGDGVVSFILDSQSLAVTGICTCNIRIVKDGQIVTSLGFSYKVIDDPYTNTDSSVESANDYPVLSELLVRVNEALVKANGLNTFYETNLAVFTDLASNSQILLDIAKNKDEAKALIDSIESLKAQLDVIYNNVKNIEEIKNELNVKLETINKKLLEVNAMYTDMDLMIQKAIKSKSDLKIQLDRYDLAKPSLDELKLKIDEAKDLLSQLNSITTSATSKINEWNTIVSEAKTLNDLIVKNTASANATNSSLLSTKASADKSNDDLKSSITTANNSKSALDGSISTANTTKSNLDSSVNTANGTNTTLKATNSTAVGTNAALNETINKANIAKDGLDGSIAGAGLDGYVKTIDNDKQLALKEDKANKGQPSGYASLDDSGKVPLTQLPKIDTLPVGGTNGQVLKSDGNGGVVWGTDNDTKYTHPSTHPATMITEDTTHRFASDTEKTTWNAKQDKLTASTNITIAADGKTISAKDTTYSVATTSANGLMSSTDKSKLDNIEANAQKNTITTVNGKTGDVAISKSDLGLGSVENIGIKILKQAQYDVLSPTEKSRTDVLYAISG